MSFFCPQVQSIDMGLYPVDTDSSDDDLFTGNVWWEEGGKDNPAFEASEETQEGESKKKEEPPAEEPAS